jgi:hypothetical protein
VAVGTSFLVFSQNMFAAIFVTIANTVFQESLRSNILSHAPGVSPEAAIAAGGGAEAVRQLAPPGSELLEGVLLSYSNSVSDVLYLIVALTVIGFLASFGMGWVDLRKTTESETLAPSSQSEKESA